MARARSFTATHSRAWRALCGLSAGTVLAPLRTSPAGKCAELEGKKLGRGVEGQNLQRPTPPRHRQLVSHGQLAIDQQVDQRPAHAERQFVRPVELDRQAPGSFGRIDEVGARLVADLRLRPAGVGADVAQRLVRIVAVEGDADRLPGLPAGGAEAEPGLEIVGRRRLQPQGRAARPIGGLHQPALGIDRAPADLLPNVRPLGGKVVAHERRRLGRRFFCGRLGSRLGRQFFRRHGLGQLLSGRGQQLPIGGAGFSGRLEVRLEHAGPQTGIVRRGRQRHGLDAKRVGGQERRHAGLQHPALVRIAVVAADVQVRRRVEIAVEHARDAVVLEIQLAAGHVGPHLVRLEHGPQPVVILLGDRVVLVVVALRAIERQAEHRLGRVLDRFIEPGRAIEAKILPGEKAGRPQPVGVRRIQLVGGEHLAEHLVVGLIGGERLDDPIAPVPEVLLRVADFGAQPPPVADTRQMSIQCRAQRSAYCGLASRRSTMAARACGVSSAARASSSARVGGRPIRSRLTRRSQIRGSARCWATRPRRSRSAARKRVDRIAVPGRISRCRYGGSDCRAECPVVARVAGWLLVGGGRGSLVDPGPNQGDLVGRQRLALGGHPLCEIGRGDLGDQQALAALGRLDRRTALAAAPGRRRRIEPQGGLALERAVAGVAPGLQDRLDLAEVVDLGPRRQLRGAGQQGAPGASPAERFRRWHGASQFPAIDREPFCGTRACLEPVRQIQPIQRACPLSAGSWSSARFSPGRTLGAGGSRLGR